MHAARSSSPSELRRGSSWTASGIDEQFDLIPVGGLDFEELCALFDEVDEFLATSEVTRFGVRYAEAGMDVHYDERSRRRFAEAMESDERFDEMLTMTGTSRPWR